MDNRTYPRRRLGATIGNLVTNIYNQNRIIESKSLPYFVEIERSMCQVLH